MAYAPQAVQVAVFTALNGSASLTSKISASRVFDSVQKNQGYPYVVIDVADADDRGSQTSDGWTQRLTVHVFQQGANHGKKFIQETQEIIDDLLHNQALSFTGFTNLSMRRVNSTVIVEGDNTTYHGIQTFEILTGEP